jgi:ATP-binding protein involved in chromosome partitioning
MADTLQRRITAALANVRNARSGTDVVTGDMVRDIATTVEGRVRLTLRLAPDDDATLVRDVRQAVERLDGVTDVRVDVEDAARVTPPQAGAPRAPRPPGTGRALPTIDQAPKAPPRPSAPTPVAYPNLGRIIAVSSGKGGVGKSTVTTNLAVALAASGASVGILDADVYGPNIPRMMGVNAPPPVENNRIMPLQAHGVKVMSIGFMIERDQPAIWRGPIVMKIVTQFLRDVAWGTLDYLLVDMPPGTGDAQLSLVQATQVSGAIIVTTPQEVATGDALRGAKMFLHVGVPVLGIVENMSWFECPHCDERTPLFGSGGGARLADELGIPLLGQIPIAPRIVPDSDAGIPIVVGDPESGAASALRAIAAEIEARAPAAARG